MTAKLKRSVANHGLQHGIRAVDRGGLPTIKSYSGRPPVFERKKHEKFSLSCQSIERASRAIRHGADRPAAVSRCLRNATRRGHKIEKGPKGYRH
jgi:hypothetical protein